MAMRELHLIAHNIRSLQNVGALFRIADALGVAKIWLTGYTPGPGHIKLAKTALGAEKAVTFEMVLEVEKVIKDLKAQNFRILGLELDPKATPLPNYRPTADRMGLILGNEVEGILPYLRDWCDDIVYIPQKGVKESLNVSVAAGIACYALMLE